MERKHQEHKQTNIDHLWPLWPHLSLLTSANFNKVFLDKILIMNHDRKLRSGKNFQEAANGACKNIYFFSKKAFFPSHSIYKGHCIRIYV